MVGGVDLVRFTQSLSAAASLEHLERAFLAGFGPLLGAQVYGYDLWDPVTAQPLWSARATVSDAGPAPTQATRLPLRVAGAFGMCCATPFL